MRIQSQHLVKLIMVLAIALMGGFFWLCGGVVQADDGQTDYLNQKLVDYQIPANVVQVIIDNSLDANGQRPNVSAQDLTVGDVQQFKTFSLAVRTKNSDGTYTSATSDTVANWIASLKTNDNNYVETADMLLYQDIAQDDGQNFTPAKLLTSGIMENYGHQAYDVASLPVYNALMAIAMSATNATTVDLTGIVSQVNDSGSNLRMKMLAMFRTSDLTNLQELDLGRNMFGAETMGGWAYDSFMGATLKSSSVVTWDLSYENLATLDANLLKNLGNQTRNINLSSNVLKTINYNNGQYLGVTGPDGSVDLGDNTKLDTDDGATFYVLATILSTGGKTILPDPIANEVVAKAITTWPNINNLGVAAVADQLTDDTLATVINAGNAADLLASINVNELTSAAIQGLSEDDFTKLVAIVKEQTDGAAKVKILISKRRAIKDLDVASITASGSWNFGSYILGSADRTLSDLDNNVTLSGSLPAGQQISVTMGAWQSESASFDPALKINTTSDGWLLSDTDLLVNQPVTAFRNQTSEKVAFDLVLNHPELTIPDDQITNLKQQEYTGTLTWAVEDIPAADVAGQ